VEFGSGSRSGNPGGVPPIAHSILFGYDFNLNDKQERTAAAGLSLVNSSLDRTIQAIPDRVMRAAQSR